MPLRCLVVWQHKRVCDDLAELIQGSNDRPTVDSSLLDDIKNIVLEGRRLKAKSGSDGSGGGASSVVSFNPFTAPTRVNGLFVYLQSIVCLGICIRVLHYFRGSLQLGALAHTMGAIVVDILPLLFLLLVFVVAFCAACMVLIMQEELDETDHEWFWSGGNSNEQRKAPPKLKLNANRQHGTNA